MDYVFWPRGTDRERERERERWRGGRRRRFPSRGSARPFRASGHPRSSWTWTRLSKTRGPWSTRCKFLRNEVPMAKQLLSGLTQKHISAPHSHCVRWIFWEVLRSALGARRSLKLKSWPLQVSNEIPPFREQPTSPAILPSSVAHTRARRGSHCEGGARVVGGSIPVERISYRTCCGSIPCLSKGTTQPATDRCVGRKFLDCMGRLLHTVCFAHGALSPLCLHRH